MSRIESISPEEIQKEFEDFVKKRFGDHVQVVAQQIRPAGPFDQEGSDFRPTSKGVGPEKKDKTDPKRFEFDLRPRDIKNHLDQFVVKQDEAKKALAIAVCDHYNHVKENIERPNDDLEYSKQNVLLLGPTGVGKTYLVKNIAKLIGVPFVKADATRFSETGYVGANVDDLIHDLVNQANGDIELAQYGIIYLDETDKLAGMGEQRSKDVNGRGVQFALLKLMEETEVDLRSGNDMRSQMQAFMDFQKKGKPEPKIINTKHILFIVSGSFSGIAPLIRQRISQTVIGFNRGEGKVLDDEQILDLANTEDFIKFGFEPEFVGRLPVRVACKELGVEDLKNILSNSKGSILHQYRRAFASYGILLDFCDDAIQAIAETAAGEGTGARGLMTVCEKIFRDFKYELPSLEIDNLVVDVALITDPRGTLSALTSNLSPRHDRRLLSEIDRFTGDFFSRHAMSLQFTGPAGTKLATRAKQSEIPLYDFICQLFRNFEHGLKLINQNIGQTNFVIDESVVNNPDASLELWIKNSFLQKGENSKLN